MRNCLVEAIYAERENSGLASKYVDLPKSKREHPSDEFHDSCAGRPHVEGNDRRRLFWRVLDVASFYLVMVRGGVRALRVLLSGKSRQSIPLGRIDCRRRGRRLPSAAARLTSVSYAAMAVWSSKEASSHHVDPKNATQQAGQVHWSSCAVVQTRRSSLWRMAFLWSQ
jgi:hypothetical protein